MYQKEAILSQIETLIVMLTQFEDTFSFWEKALAQSSQIESLLNRSWYETREPESQAEMYGYRDEAQSLWGLFLIIEEDSRFGKPTYRYEARRALSRYATLLVSIQDSEV